MSAVVDGRVIDDGAEPEGVGQGRFQHWFLGSVTAGNLVERL
jgi:hypothetical protein